MTRASLISLALLTGSLGLQAQDSMLGGQLHLDAPNGDFKSEGKAKTGYGAGLHLLVDLNQGHVLRPRVDYTRFDREEEHLGAGNPYLGVPLTVSGSYTSVAVGVDYLYFLSGRPEGAYLLGGAAMNRWKGTVTLQLGGSPSTNLQGAFNESTTRLALAAGLGYQVTKRWGAELRYSQSSLSATESAKTFQVGVTLRF